MFDPFSLAAGAGILAVGFFTGRLTRRAGRTELPAAATCGCTHGLEQHDPDTKSCHAKIKGDWYDDDGDWKGDLRPCTCRQYVGPKPLEDLFAPQYLPPVE